MCQAINREIVSALQAAHDKAVLQEKKDAEAAEPEVPDAAVQDDLRKRGRDNHDDQEENEASLQPDKRSKAGTEGDQGGSGLDQGD